MLLLVALYVCLVAFHESPVVLGVRPLTEDSRASFKDLSSQRVAEVGFETCPGQCGECCARPPDVNLMGLRPPSRKTFKCLLKANETPVPDPACKNIKHSSTKGMEHLFTMECQLKPSAAKTDRMKNDPLLNNVCSKHTKCCCDGKGLSLCLGDQTNKFRLEHVYGKQLPDLRLTSHFFCPPGFSEYDIVGQMCKCDVSCGKSPPGSEPKRALPSDTFWGQMSSLAAGIYNFENPVSGWMLVKRWDVDEGQKFSNDEVGIYSRRLPGHASNTCALTFAGTDDLQDVIADIKVVFSKTWCGYNNVHRGFSGEADDFMKGKRFEEFSRFLSDPETCGGGVVAVGHSLGGAIAELVAACVNKLAAHDVRFLPLTKGKKHFFTRLEQAGEGLGEGLGKSSGKREQFKCEAKERVVYRYSKTFEDKAEAGLNFGQTVVGFPDGTGERTLLGESSEWLRVDAGDVGLSRGFQVDEVYTFAAPSVAKEIIRNALTSDGCFPGGRFFIQDTIGYDPVPALATLFGFRHPNMNMIRLKNWNEDYDHESTACTTRATQDYGKHRRVLQGKNINTEPHGATFKATIVTRHVGDRYVDRIQKDEAIATDPLGVVSIKTKSGLEERIIKEETSYDAKRAQCINTVCKYGGFKEAARLHPDFLDLQHDLSEEEKEERKEIFIFLTSCKIEFNDLEQLDADKKLACVSPAEDVVTERAGDNSSTEDPPR